MTLLEAVRRLQADVYEVMTGDDLQPGVAVGWTECRYCRRDCGPEYGRHESGCPAQELTGIVTALEIVNRAIVEMEDYPIQSEAGGAAGLFLWTDDCPWCQVSSYGLHEHEPDCEWRTLVALFKGTQP